MYSRLLETHPVITKCLTSGVIMSLGDLLTQKSTYCLTQSLRKRKTSTGKGMLIYSLSVLSTLGLLCMGGTVKGFLRWSIELQALLPANSLVPLQACCSINFCSLQSSWLVSLLCRESLDNAA